MLLKIYYLIFFNFLKFTNFTNFLIYQKNDKTV